MNLQLYFIHSSLLEIAELNKIKIRPNQRQNNITTFKQITRSDREWEIYCGHNCEWKLNCLDFGSDQRLNHFWESRKRGQLILNHHIIITISLSSSWICQLICWLHLKILIRHIISQKSVIKIIMSNKIKREIKQHQVYPIYSHTYTVNKKDK